jgi:hypothetical protein
MQRSGLLVAYGLVVGTSAKARVPVPLNGDAAFRFTPPSSDMDRLGRGLEALATVLFEAGARRVLLNTWDHGNITSPADIARIRTLTKDPEFITLASSHPQGETRSIAIRITESWMNPSGFTAMTTCTSATPASSPAACRSTRR